MSRLPVQCRSRWSSGRPHWESRAWGWPCSGDTSCHSSPTWTVARRVWGGNTFVIIYYTSIIYYMYILSILWQKDNSWTHFYLRMNKRPYIANSLCEFLSPTFIWKWDICVGFWLHFICFLSPEIECEPGHLLHVALLVVLRDLLHGNLAEADLTFSVWNVTNPNIKKMLIII